MINRIDRADGKEGADGTDRLDRKNMIDFVQGSFRNSCDVYFG